MRFFQHGACSFNWSEENILLSHRLGRTIIEAWQFEGKNSLIFLSFSSVLLSKEFFNQAEMLNKRKLIEWELWSHLVKVPYWIEEDMEPPEIFLSLSSKSPESLTLIWILEKKTFEMRFVSTNIYSEFINVKLLRGFIQRWDRHSFKEHIS